MKICINMEEKMIEDRRRIFSKNELDNIKIQNDKHPYNIVNYYMECFSFADVPTANQEFEEIKSSDGILRYKKICQHVIERISSISPRLVADCNKIDQIIDNYEKYKNIIRKNMQQNILNQDIKILLDSHKLAAAFFCAFLKSNPISFSYDKSEKPVTYGENYANEQGGFLFGLQVIQDFTSNKYLMSTSDDESEICRNVIKLPETNGDSYICWFIQLAVNMKKYLDFDNPNFDEKLIFVISHIYSILESYSYQYNRAELYNKRN